MQCLQNRSGRRQRRRSGRIIDLRGLLLVGFRGRALSDVMIELCTIY
jgi:hypothetical protein